MHDKLTLFAVAALFKYAHRDVRFYLNDIPGNELKLPSPKTTPPGSGSGSAAPSPPKALVQGAVEAKGGRA